MNIFILPVGKGANNLIISRFVFIYDYIILYNMSKHILNDRRIFLRILGFYNPSFIIDKETNICDIINVHHLLCFYIKISYYLQPNTEDHYETFKIKIHCTLFDTCFQHGKSCSNSNNFSKHSFS